MDLTKMRGGKKGQQQLSQAIAMESANRVITRKALDMLKSIAIGEYKPVEETPAVEEQKQEEIPAAEEPKQEDVQAESAGEQDTLRPAE
jgi:hypothetical protein